MPGKAGHRSLWAPLLLLVYLLAAPKLFVLGPLTLLLLLSRPRTVREWAWIGASVALALVTLRTGTALPDRTLRAAGALFTGGFVMASLVGIPSLMRRALASIALAVAGTIAWFAVLRIRWSELQAAITATQWAVYRRFFPGLPDTPPDGSAVTVGTTAEFAVELARNMAALVDLWPAINAVLALIGGWLAWTWYHRVASEPIGAVPRPLREFTFSDHVVWLVIACGAATLAPLPPTVSLVVGNLLLFLLVLYVGRGLAVIRTALLPAPLGLAFILSTAAILLLPLALIVAALVGLADTWLDLRRRMAPPEGVSP